MTRCFVCLQPALMGYHPLCVLASARINPGGETTPDVCPSCPFRKGPVWMDKGRHVLNMLRLKYNNHQHCHIGYGNYPSVCLGSVICLGGGSGQVHNSREFAKLELAKTEQEAMERYNQRLLTSETPERK